MARIAPVRPIASRAMGIDVRATFCEGSGEDFPSGGKLHEISTIGSDGGKYSYDRTTRNTA
jgi:hypothetical protein